MTRPPPYVGVMIIDFFYDRLNRHATAVDSEVNPGFIVDDEIFLNCDNKTVAFLCSTSLF